MLRLYTYFRSSAAYRVRIALNLKGLAYEAVPVHLLRDGGQQNQPAYRALSPLGTVPALQTGDGTFTQSLAIIEYLDEIHPLPPLLPASAEDRARVRALAQTIACDIHPVNNLRVLQYLGKHFAATQEQKDAWYRHWVNAGLLAVEQLLADAGRLLPGAAALQCPPLRLPARRAADHPAHRRRLRSAASFLQRGPGDAAGRRMRTQETT